MTRLITIAVLVGLFAAGCTRVVVQTPPVVTPEAPAETTEEEAK